MPAWPADGALCAARRRYGRGSARSYPVERKRACYAFASVTGRGHTARIQLDALNLDAWYTAVRPVFRAIEDTGQPDLLSVYWPNRIQAKISALTLGRRHWQNLMLDAVRRAPQPEDTPARASIWQIDALRVDNPDAQMQAHGYWRTGAPDSPDTPGGADQTNKIALDFSLRL